MKLVTYTVRREELTVSAKADGAARIGWMQNGYVIDVGSAQEWATLVKGIPITRVLPTDMIGFLDMGEEGMEILKTVAEAVRGEDPVRLHVEGEPVALREEEVQLLPPVPVPRSFRDFYAFEQHVKTARARRGLEMVPEWYRFPVFYFSNARNFVGPDAPVARPSRTKCLDFELEIACIIGKPGINIPAERAREHMAGFCVLNDWSARDLQREEMKVGLGPAKGKDFATSLGPCLVTLDELEPRRVGDRWDLTMTARVNGREISRGNAKDLYFSFAQMVERASENVMLYPGDVIGSGTVGTGCILELGTEVHRWLEPGDVVELEIEGLGILKNRVTESKNL